MTYVVFGAVLALLSYLGVVAALTFRATAGTIADKLAAAWKGSLTIFVLAWGAILTAGVNILDQLSSVTGDPQFAQFADSVKGIIPQTLHPYVPPAIMGIGIAARLAHNPPTPKSGK